MLRKVVFKCCVVCSTIVGVCRIIMCSNSQVKSNWSVLMDIFCTCCSLRAMFVAGEHCDVQTLGWIRDRFGVPVLDNWWQTGLDQFKLSVSA